MRHYARKILGSAVLVALGASFAIRHRTAAASDTDDITWGATDPTWSPDGSRLAFSLFGSIWQVPAAGGTAEQLSTSSGYHAHPAWSPKGDQIAFVRGQPPASGYRPNISGTLVLLNVETGEERQIQMPSRVSGTVSWSPDGSRLAVPLFTDSGALIHELDAASGKSRAIQALPIRFRENSTWIDTAWNPKSNEIYFSAERRSDPQIWSMPSGGVPIMVQMPLTRYRAEDVVHLQSLSALPDGSGLVYGADVVNRAGNFELYRIGAKGGQPVAITHTPRDEFAPAVSPDGKLVAHVSNQMGNIDLYTMPLAGGEKKHVAITGLKFRKPGGRLRVRVTDELENRTPVRLYVKASDDKAYCPRGTQIFYYFLEPRGGREGFFLAGGDDTFPVPAGKVRLTAVKGLEYEIAERTVDVAPGETAEIAIPMQRWTNWNQRGWYTGENHFHANYNGYYYQRPKDSMRWLEAMDLNTSNMVVANSQGAFVHDKEFFRGAPDPLSNGRYVLYWGEEYRNSFPLGHMLFLGLKKLVPPFFTSVIGSNSPYDFPLNTMAAQAARRQGAVVSYAHPMYPGAFDVFDSNLGGKEAPVTAALGAMDLIDVIPPGIAAYEMWYSLLNSGFRIAPGAGTDVFTNWRGIRMMPGGAREYVESGPDMNWDRWLARLRQGREFVTNGPLLTFSVNGEPMGSVIKVADGETYTARLAAEITSRVPVRQVEFIQNGKVIESREVPAGTQSFRMEKEVPVQKSCWFAVRVSGLPARGVYDDSGVAKAHSGAIYIDVGGRPTLVKEDIELMIGWVDRLWLLLEERRNLGPGNNREVARQMFAQAREHYRAKLARAGQ
jgi:Tol biopolymer transport system component